MDFETIVKKRSSIRAYKDKPVEEAKLKKLMEIINSAPSAGNLQSYHVLIVKNPEKKKGLASAALEQEFIAEAGAVFVFFADQARAYIKYEERGESLYSVQDATIAAAYAQLGAASLGLSTVWVGAFDPEKVKNLFGLKKGLEPVAIIPVGYQAEEPEIHGRRKISDMFTVL